MSPTYLLDTNIVIYIRRNRPQTVLDRFKALPPGDVAMSVITFGELHYGAEKSPLPHEAKGKLDELVALVPVLHLPASVGPIYGSTRADLERRGEVIGNNDLWIAAHAKACGLVLVTNNEREFSRVAGLRIENWSIPG